MALVKKGKYWHYDFWFQKQRYQGTTYQANVNKARLVESAVRSNAGLGVFGVGPAKTSPLLAEFLGERGAFVEYCYKHAKARRTGMFYAEKCKRLLEFPAWQNMRLTDIDGERIADYSTYRLKTVANDAVNGELATLRKALRLAEEWRLIPRAPRVRLLPPGKGREFVVSGELEIAYFAVASTPLKQAAALILDLGLRPEECVRLTGRDISTDTLTVQDGKSKNAARALPLTERASCQIGELRSLRPDSEFLFPGRKGKHLTRGALDNMHAKLRAENDWPKEFVLYCFRHTFGTRLAESGASSFQIKTLMGHYDIKMSQRYIHPGTEGLELAMRRKEMLDRAIRGEVLPQEIVSAAGKPLV